MHQRVSPSAIHAFINCPALYRYKFIEQKTPVGLDSRGEEGLRIHQYLDQHARGLLKTLPPETSQTVHEMWEYYLHYIKQFEGLPFKSEFDFYIPYPIENIPLMLTGRVDRLIIFDDHLLVLDWKTGSFHEEESGETQMAFYAWSLAQMSQYFNQIEVNYIDTRCIYLKEKKAVNYVFTAKDMPALKSRFEPIIKQMDKDKFCFSPDPRVLKNQQPYCTRCYYQAICPGATYSKMIEGGIADYDEETHVLM